jgi:hypothetical protein
VFEAVADRLQLRLHRKREVSAIFRHVWHAWPEAVLWPNDAPEDARVWRKFGGVKALHLKASLLKGSLLRESLVNDDDLRALAPLVSLKESQSGGLLKWGSRGLDRYWAEGVVPPHHSHGMPLCDR